MDLRSPQHVGNERHKSIPHMKYEFELHSIIYELSTLKEWYLGVHSIQICLSHMKENINFFIANFPILLCSEIFSIF